MKFSLPLLSILIVQIAIHQSIKAQNPIAKCKDITVELDSLGNASIQEDAIDNGSTGQGISYDTNITTFSCAEIGDNPVELTVTDTLNKTSTCSSNVIVKDIIPPKITCNPLSINLSENGEYVLTEMERNSLVSGSTDNCSLLEPENFDFLLQTFSFECVHVQLTEAKVQISANDGSRNSTIAYCQVSVNDITPPKALCIDTLKIQLDQDGDANIFPNNINDANNFEDVPAWARTYNDIYGGSYDACGISALELSRNAFDYHDEKFSSVTLTVYDPHGNSDQCNAIVEILNHDPQIQISCPNTISVECSIPDPYPNYATFINAGGSASSNCGINEGSFTILTETNNGLACPKEAIRTYQIKDNCNNKAECIQKVILDDTTPPVYIAVPSNIFTNCRMPEPYKNYTEFTSAGGSVSDNCSLETSSFKLFGENVVSLSCPTIVNRSYVVYDECGNPSIFTQKITVNDEIEPSIICPSDTIVPFNKIDPGVYATYSNFINAGGIAIDNCSINESSFSLLSEINDGNDSLEIRTRMYEISDACGNTASCSHNITVLAESTTSITCPQESQHQCIEDIPYTFSNFSGFKSNGGSVSSNCGIDTTSFTLINQFTDNNYCPETLSRTYEITDSCGSSIQCIQTIIISDTTFPIISCMDDTLVFDISEIPMADISKLSASDNCGEIFLSHVGDSTNNARCPEIITRSYQATDGCGYVSKCVQQIVINDTISPSIICPKADTIFNLDNLKPGFQSVSDFITAGGIIEDNASMNSLNLSMLIESLDSTFNPTIVLRTYNISDYCNNEATCIHKTVLGKPTGHKDFLSENRVSILPNPSKGLFTIKFNSVNKSPYDLIVLNNKAQQIWQKIDLDCYDLKNVEVDLRNQPKGIYYLIISSQKGKITRQLIFQ